MVDQRHTLPNLKYLLTVLTAGKGEVPVRKKGGARILENSSIGEQRVASQQREEAEKSSLTNGRQQHHNKERTAEEIQNT